MKPHCIGNRTQALSCTLLAVAILLVDCKTLAAEELFTPPPGSSLRASLCNALRDTVYPEREKKGFEVRFVIEHLKVAGEWACFSGDAKKSPQQAGEEENPALSAVFRRNANGVWRCLAWGFHGDLSTARELFGDIAVPESVLPEWMWRQNGKSKEQ